MHKLYSSVLLKVLQQNLSIDVSCIILKALMEMQHSRLHASADRKYIFYALLCMQNSTIRTENETALKADRRGDDDLSSYYQLVAQRDKFFKGTK